MTPLPPVMTLLSALFDMVACAGNEVKFAPLIAGSVPVNWPAGILVRFAPLPVTAPVTLPLKLFAVTIPATTIPSTLVVIVPTPVSYTHLTLPTIYSV